MSKQANVKTDPTETARIARLRGMTPMMAALSSVTDDWLQVKASEAMWRDLERCDAS